MGLSEYHLYQKIESKCLPIWKVSQFLEHFTNHELINIPQDKNKTAISGPPRSSHYPLLRALVYRVSNGIILPDSDEINNLLEKINEFGARNALQKLLAEDSPSIMAACEFLVMEFYRRADYEMLKSVRKSHPEIELDLYDMLTSAFVYSDLDCLKNQDYIMRILQDLKIDGSPPSDASEALVLLYMCRKVISRVDVFLDLWNAEDISAQEIDHAGAELGALEYMPLCTDCPVQMKLLLDSGFAAGQSIFLLQAIIQARLEATLILFDYLDLEVNVDLPISQSECLAFGSIWEAFDVSTFYGIIEKVVSEERWEGVPPIPRIYREDWLLVRLACLQPEMEGYVIQVLQRKYPTMGPNLFTSAIDLIFLTPDFSNIWNFLARSNPNGHSFWKQAVSALQTFLKAATDISATKLWQKTIWEILVRNTDDIPAIEILETLLNAGADPQITLAPSLVDNLNSILNSPLLQTELGGGPLEVVKPIDIAFLLQEPSAFCLLLNALTSNDIDQFIQKLTSLPEHELLIAGPQFLDAAQNRNYNLVESLWNKRFETMDQAFISAFTKGEIEITKALVTRYTASSRHLRFVLALIKTIIGRKKISKIYEEGISLLNWMLQGGTNFNAISEFQEASTRYIEEYNSLLLETMRHGTIELFRVLLGFISRQGSPGSFHSFPELQKQGINPVPHAARLENLDFLKCLIELGFDINQGVQRKSTVGSISPTETALGSALMRGDLRGLTYILKQGADIYAPCEGYASGVENAVAWRRIDAVALILATDPDCYDLALAASVSLGHNLIEDHIRGERVANGSSG
ncbi:hypothetical protein AOL_s00140g18 [Orbilia oligospora ATCC 24927]|uniref:Uncharacterized protein n=1 Tax=Arthrobotrys oligospora (strain ATCC 24927 / CBS 115.81 / DSM 1491) TaxID=756982 RepID=G1XM49_ARTOA|nr:hypothetical protein AOL_s00140g18 [Orbilia oligospora ATCC 24927]EGX45702.1 hypothetical protein AOL_s00140g18 [Orbilia oligospora ATCC 24927]